MLVSNLELSTESSLVIVRFDMLYGISIVSKLRAKVKLGYAIGTIKKYTMIIRVDWDINTSY